MSECGRGVHCYCPLPLWFTPRDAVDVQPQRRLWNEPLETQKLGKMPHFRVLQAVIDNWLMICSSVAGYQLEIS